MTEPQRTGWGLLRRRQCLVPTWRGWLALLLGLVVLVLVFAHTIYPFLTPNDPAPGGILVVEGWAPDWVLRRAVAEFQHNHYDQVYVTGIPIEYGAPLYEYNSYAEIGAAILVKLGLSSNVVQAVPAPRVARDRTYASAAALKRWLREHQLAPTKLNLITSGPHARRSRMLFQRAFGKDTKVGIMAIDETDYDWSHWWRTSRGVRAVVDETVAYAYARLLFQTPKDSP